MIDFLAFPRRTRPATTLATLALAALLGVVLLAACGDDDEAPPPPATAAAATATAAATEAPAPATATATATEAPPEPEPTAAPPAPGYPRQVTDLLGREVTLPDKPAAIVALSPTAAELVYAVGGAIIGRSQTVSHPPEAAEAESVGSAYQPNFETILALQPDLIVADSTIHTQPDVLGALEQLDVPVIFAGAAAVDEVVAGLTLLGQALDVEDAAAAAAAAVEAARLAASEALADLEITAVLLIGDRDRVLYAANGSSYAGSILAALGIVNPAGDLADAGPFPGFTRVAPELMLEMNPLYILTVTPAPPPAPRLSGMLGLFPGFSGLQALAEGRVIELDVELFVQAPGPRVVEAFETLIAALGGGG